MSTLGSLATSWSMPASCSAQLGLYEFETISTVSSTAYLLNYKALGPTDIAACMPPSYTPEFSSYYYPASVCPSGYTTGCNPTITVDSASVTQTAVTCCPTQNTYSCFSGSLDYPWMSTLACTTSVDITTTIAVTYVYLNGTTSLVVTTATPGPYAGWAAYGIQLLAAEETSSSSSGSTPVATATASSAVATSDVQSESSNSSSSSSSSSSSLSDGAVAGIAVGVTAVFIATVIGIFLLFRRLRRKRVAEQRTQMDLVTYSTPKDGMGELQGSEPHVEELFSHPRPSEMDGKMSLGSSTAELASDETAARYEAPGSIPVDKNVYELPGHSQR